MAIESVGAKAPERSSVQPKQDVRTAREEDDKKAAAKAAGPEPKAEVKEPAPDKTEVVA